MESGLFSVTLLFFLYKRDTETETRSGCVPKLTLLEQDPRVGSDSPLPWKGGAGNQAELNILEDAVQCLTSCFPPEVKLAVCVCSVASVMSDSLRPYRLQPTRLLCPWDSPGKNTGVGCHSLLH